MYNDEDEDEVDEDLETSENSGDHMMKVTSDFDLRCKLGEWFISDGTSQRLARKLLQILRNADPQSQRFRSVPKDPRSLYPKVNACHEVIFDDHVLPGEYAYIGMILVYVHFHYIVYCKCRLFGILTYF